MFDIGWSELVLIGIVALIAIGPKELPGVLRTVGQWMGKVRRMASEFQGQFQEAMREAEMGDLKKQVEDMASTASSYGQFDPVESIRKEFDTATEDRPPAAPEATADAVPVAPVVAAEIPAPVSSDFSIPQPASPEPAEAHQPQAQPVVNDRTGEKTGGGA